MKIQSPNSSIGISGEVQVTTTLGVAILNNLNFLAPPGSTKVQFVVNSPSIVTKNIIQYFNLTGAAAVVNHGVVQLDFRNCIKGEYVL